MERIESKDQLISYISEGEKNPSDVVIKLADGGFVGYSNKIASGSDKFRCRGSE